MAVYVNGLLKADVVLQYPTPAASTLRLLVNPRYACAQLAGG